jgi:hypothetical protein
VVQAALNQLELCGAEELKQLVEIVRLLRVIKEALA